DWAVKGTPLVLDLASIDFDQLVEQVHIVKTIRMNRRGIYFASLEFEIIRLSAEEADQVSAKRPEDFIDDTMGLHHSDVRTDDGGTKGKSGRPDNPGEGLWNYGPRGVGENDYRVPEIHDPWATGPVVRPPKRPPW